MAYTRIHAIKSTVTKAVAHICNPDKTEQQLLVDSFGCSPETAMHDFDYALSRTKQSDKNQAYHLIQSFAKGEVSHEEAHRIGIELADKLLGGKYSYVVATHLYSVKTGSLDRCSYICPFPKIISKQFFQNLLILICHWHRMIQLKRKLCQSLALFIILRSRYTQIHYFFFTNHSLSPRIFVIQIVLIDSVSQVPAMLQALQCMSQAEIP